MYKCSCIIYDAILSSKSDEPMRASIRLLGEFIYLCALYLHSYKDTRPVQNFDAGGTC